MTVLYINAAFREDSRTQKLAQYYLKRFKDVKTINLGENQVMPLDNERLKVYNKSVSMYDYSDEMFIPAKEFAKADEIVIAAPFWNFGLPGVLSAYLEMICSQGVSFDLAGTGQYCSLCKAKTITFITTAGGRIPENNHAFGFINDLNNMFWKIPKVNYYKAEGLDVYGTNVENKLSEVYKKIDEEREY